MAKSSSALSGSKGGTVHRNYSTSRTVSRPGRTSRYAGCWNTASVSSAGAATFADQVIADLALAPLMRVPIRALSKGQRKRTLLALGLLAPQPILLIDEPFEGLDLRQSREAAATLRKHLTPDRTFFLSIHQIADAAKVCDRFVLLSGGRVVAEGALDMLTALARQRAGHDLPPDFEEVFLALT